MEDRQVTPREPQLKVEPLDWHLDEANVWTSTSESIPLRIEPLRGIVNVLRRRRVRLVLGGGHAPEWWFATLDEAKAKAEQINCSAPVYNGEEDWRPGLWPAVVSDGEQVRPLPGQPKPPKSARRCHSCRSIRRPVAVEPLQFTEPWWNDPSAFWRCPGCGASRGDL